MEAISRNGRVGVVLGVLGCLLAAGITSWFQPGAVPSHLEEPGIAGVEPAVELAGLYSLDHLMFEEEPVLDLLRLAPVGSGPPSGAAVPEPRVATLWILALAVLYALYLPARSC